MVPVGGGGRRRRRGGGGGAAQLVPGSQPRQAVHQAPRGRRRGWGWGRQSDLPDPAVHVGRSRWGSSEAEAGCGKGGSGEAAPCPSVRQSVVPRSGQPPVRLASLKGRRSPPAALPPRPPGGAPRMSPCARAEKSRGRSEAPLRGLWVPRRPSPTMKNEDEKQQKRQHPTDEGQQQQQIDPSRRRRRRRRPSLPPGWPRGQLRARAARRSEAPPPRAAAAQPPPRSPNTFNPPAAFPGRRGYLSAPPTPCSARPPAARTRRAGQE